MAVRSNRFYNNADIGQGFSNLAQMFAPPSGADAAGWAAASAKKAEAARLADLFGAAKDPNFDRGTFDRMGVAVGNYAPSSSYYAVDTTAATSRSNNAADNARAISVANIGERGATDRAMLAPVGANETRFIPQGMADFYDTGSTQVGGVKLGQGERMFTPDGGSYVGEAKPLSLVEQQAQERQELRASGDLTNKDLVDLIVGAETPVKVAGDNGPEYWTPGAAARASAPAYVEPGNQAKPSNGVALLPNGTQVPAIQDLATGRWKHAQTGQDLPADIRIFDTPKPTGTNTDVGLSKPANTDVEKRLIDMALAEDTATQLRELISKSPASQGVVGWARGTAQNLIQQGGEVGKHFGGSVAEINKRIAEGLEDASLAGAFDPSIPAIEMLSNLLAFQYAKTTTGERLSNEMLQNTRASLGLTGMSANQASSLARIDTALNKMQRDKKILLDARRGGVSAVSAEAPPPPPVTINPPPDAVQLLRTSPDTAPQFDEIFGPGAAARILGGQ